MIHMNLIRRTFGFFLKYRVKSMKQNWKGIRNFTLSKLSLTQDYECLLIKQKQGLDLKLFSGNYDKP